MTDDWDTFEKKKHQPDIQHAMRCRCEEQGHEYEKGLMPNMVFVLICKWCGDRSKRYC
jgi:hypothetical protein